MKFNSRYYFKRIDEFPFQELFDVKVVFEILKKKNEVFEKFSESRISGLGKDVHFEGLVIIEEGARVLQNTILEGPVYIGKNSIIGPAAYIRSGTIIGENCKVRGEIKNSIVMNDTKVPHHSYIGDSIIGSDVNFAAGSVITNFKFDGSDIKLNDYNLGRKFGAIIGDEVKVGSNVTFMPGTLVGPGCWIYPEVLLRGFIEENTIVKNKPIYEFVKKK